MTVARRRNPRGSGEQLRADIVAATKDLLAAAESSAAVSIRAVADAVGVTPPSIYLHFEDKDALLEAVVADVFAELDVEMLAAGEGITDPVEILCAYGLAYVKFAIEHPEHYRLATMERHTAMDEASHLDTVLAASAFNHFAGVVERCMADGTYLSDDPLRVTLEMWTAAHGVASLLITKPYLPWGDELEFASRVLRSAGVGRAVNDLNGGDMQPTEVKPFLAEVRAWRSR